MESRRRALLFGVLGDPVDHSLSPAMHNAAFAAAGLPHLYLRYRVGVRALPAALAEARRLGMGGLNLTVPLKEAALPLLDALTPEAARIGAVNTIVARGRRLVGDNTDARGFLRALRGRVRLRGARAVVIGAGGAARAVGAALVAGGARAVVVANRTVARPEARAAPLAALAGRTLLADATLVVNTTSAGLAGGGLGLRPTTSPPGCLFVDLVYGTRPTPFLAAAARAGRPIADGTRMLLHQGALAFEAWTGRRAPLGAMARALARAGLPLTRPGGTPSVAAARPARA